MMTLPTDSNDRKNYAVYRGCLRYFPAALAGVSKISKLGNDKHNLGQEMHHARNKSQDHGDCILRHLIDVDSLLAAEERGESVNKEDILNEVSSMAWRALALAQIIHEQYGAPLAPGAKVDTKIATKEVKATDLFAAAEKAHEDISQMLANNKKTFPTTHSIQKLDEVNHVMRTNVKFRKGDIVQHIHNDVEVTVEGTYFDEDGKPILFVKDVDQKIFGVDPSFYKGIYK